MVRGKPVFMIEWCEKQAGESGGAQSNTSAAMESTTFSRFSPGTVSLRGKVKTGGNNKLST